MKDRSAFLYLEPTGEGKDFAQCGTCMMWNGAKGEDPNRCHIHGPTVEINADDSCGFYVPGPPHKAPLMASVTPEESGRVEGPVRCENCLDGDKERGVCLMFERLNANEPEVWSLDVNIKPKGCCNGFESKEDEGEDIIPGTLGSYGEE